VPSSAGTPAETAAARIGDHIPDVRDALLAGTPEQILERLDQVRAAGVDTVFIPTMFRPLHELRRDLDRFIAQIAPKFR
jgi:alkanesulfonate monooxygenase SsuD/methylene tetrahydromethanopterin reductase-like flavin-dependent oxidoreductase (luciferase family)